MKQTTELLSLFRVRWCRSSVNGNPRWCFLASATTGIMREIKTSTDNGWAYGCNIGNMKVGTVIRVTYHETRGGNLIADKWDNSRTAGTDIGQEFEALKCAQQLRTAIANSETSHKPARL